VIGDTDNGADKCRHVFIADQHPIVHAGIAALLKKKNGLFKIIGCACDFDSALAAIRQNPPDIVITSLGLPDRGGLELIREIRAHCPDVGILVYSGMDENLFAERALRSGANGYVMKNEPLSRFHEVLTRITAGQVVASEAIVQQVLGRIGGAESKTASLETLSDREMQVFQLLGQGLTGRKIAEQLHLSLKTFECHRYNICQKLGCKTASELMHLAISSFSMVVPRLSHTSETACKVFQRAELLSAGRGSPQLDPAKNRGERSSAHLSR